MQKTATGQLLYSPTDLIRFLESPFASWMDRYHLEYPGELTPDEDSAELKLVAEKGNEHEARFLEDLRAKGHDVCVIERMSDRQAAAEATRAAMRDGREIIFQGYLARDPFAGYADFLVRVEPAQDGLPAIYEPWDTKLARKVKPYYAIQLCAYAEMLEAAQGVLPEEFRIVLGTMERKRFLTKHFHHHYLEVKERFLVLMESFDPDDRPVPDPRADHGRWGSHAEVWLRERDHLVRVANIRISQIRRLEAAGINTVAALAERPVQTVPKLNPETYEALVAQARLQIETECRRSGTAEGDPLPPPAWEFLPVDPDGPPRGFELLPPASAGDIFFDIEGYPLVDGGLEYLLGAGVVEDGEFVFHDWWAHDPVEEKRSFEAFIDWVAERRRHHPDLHIYHYAPYEVTAMRTLMGKHGTREDAVDDLLRNKVFVDLYRVVRQGLRVGEPNYSIKSIEHLYRRARSGDVGTAGESIVQYANWIESGEPADWQASEILRGIREYNKDDCDSTWQLADWLRERQREAGISGHQVTSEAGMGSQPEEKEPRPEILERIELEQELLERAEQPGADPLTSLLAWFLQFHRREAKPGWWRFFDRLVAEPTELWFDLECIVGAVQQGEPEPVKRSQRFRYRFDPDQECKIRRENTLSPTVRDGMKFKVETCSENGDLVLTVSNAQLNKNTTDEAGGALPDTLDFVIRDNVNTDKIANAITAVVRRWHEEQVLPPALDQLLRRDYPRITGIHPGDPLYVSDDVEITNEQNLVDRMDGATLCIQGPPGTGKTWTGAHLILHLLAQGKNVGVTANSHKAIHNLLRACAEQADGSLSGIKAGEPRDDGLLDLAPGFTFIKDTGKAAQAYHGGLIAGTAWLFARSEMVDELDYLIVDEAGQVSLANFAGMSRSFRNAILLGDQMQLEQPIQGSHPGDSGQSAMNYLLDGRSTIPRNLGVFLGRTRRLHPAICEPISEMIYGGRLHADPSTANRVIRIPDGAALVIREAGIQFLPVEHEGNTQASEEEIAVILAVTDELLGRERTDSKGNAAGTITIPDILYVAPYNMQVRKLQERLPEGARVASVDKFQGQEAPIVILSMCASAGEFGSRGMGFLLSPNRINVAITRAQCLAIVVGDPRIASAPCATIDQMKLVNLFAMLKRVGGIQG